MNNPDEKNGNTGIRGTGFGEGVCLKRDFDQDSCSRDVSYEQYEILIASPSHY